MRKFTVIILKKQRNVNTISWPTDPKRPFLKPLFSINFPLTERSRISGSLRTLQICLIEGKGIPKRFNKSKKQTSDVYQLLEKRFLLDKCRSKKTSTCIWYDFVPSGSLLNCTFLHQWSHISYSASVSVPSTSAY